ncbi:MAG: DUF1385 domain-containing protein [Candidatus Cloacimonetes bacterium]|nr:DUF1385 domain-containing protein [Candidatus Cloacimonadota bacterium]
MSTEKKEIMVGGQAVIEGVMMRGPEFLATAIRRKDTTIEVKKEPFVSITKNHKFLGLPMVRGFVSLIEMMKIGFTTLTFSANRAELDIDEPEKSKEKSAGRLKAEEILSFAFAFGLAFVFFVLLPYKSAEWLSLSKENFLFNLFAGCLRIILFVVYIWAISRMKDIHRIFEYHGAEHKSVFAYEHQAPLNPVDVQRFSTLHPRCGTSFLFFVMLISILIFSITDTIVSYFLGHSPVLGLRIAYHLLLTPLVSGISYEVLRLSGKNIKHPLVKLMTAPGLALQRITTQPPDNEQLEVALVAMKCALELDISDHKNVVFLED